ncbi:MAG: phosphoenolpyruvate carboxykinase (ATP) [Actinomycetes bacterium]
MSEQTVHAQLEAAGVEVGAIHRNLPAPELIARALARREGILAANGALVVATGTRTGRSPADRYIVDDESAAGVAWGGPNQACSPSDFERQLERASKYLRAREVYVFDGFVGAEPAYRLPIRVVADATWHALFAHTLFVAPQPIELEGFAPGFTVIDCGALPAHDEGRDPAEHSASPVFIGISFSRRLVLIMGTMYAGEIKKALFTVMNYLLPERDVLPMHCSATAGRQGDVALYFGLSGTGKTTLSADPSRRLIGDDEHGWSDHGVFNFEGGCYAKVIRLSARAEPQIFQAIRFGSVLENVVVDPMTRAIDWDDGSITENTRATYPVDHIPGAITIGMAGTPRNVFFLTCDSYGVLPPIARLTPEMAGYHFLSGFTARLAGTEDGVDDPEPTFSPCFGAPFMPRDPVVYATMLEERLRSAPTQCWLVNTGWSGGPCGVGKRMRISVTRNLLKAALTGELEHVEMAPHPVFRVLVPAHCPGVPVKLLDARSTWADGAAYDESAAELARHFVENFKRFAGRVPEELAAAGPIAG